MTTRRSQITKTQVRLAKGHNAAANARNSRRERPKSRRANVGHRTYQEPFSPPEDWHEPVGETDGYQVRVQAPGAGYRHVVTPAEIRQRLAQLPPRFLDELEIVQLSRMTRKKQSFPCYGMQWGNALYLYPLEESLSEVFYSPPQPTFFNEARMYGGRWQQTGAVWTLQWTEDTIRDFYLNNILIHELGHLLDERNSTYADRERYAEWFAVEYGYRQSGGIDARRPRRKVQRRHHAT